MHPVLLQKVHEGAQSMMVEAQAVANALSVAIPEQMMERRLNAASSVLPQNFDAAGSRTRPVTGDRCTRYRRPGNGPRCQGRNANDRRGPGSGARARRQAGLYSNDISPINGSDEWSDYRLD
jgi:hypothetical protein